MYRCLLFLCVSKCVFAVEMEMSELMRGMLEGQYLFSQLSGGSACEVDSGLRLIPI